MSEERSKAYENRWMQAVSRAIQQGLDRNHRCSYMTGTICEAIRKSFDKKRCNVKPMDAASWKMIEFLQKEKSLSPLDAYSLASMTMDCRVGETEAAEKGVHCLVPKSL